MKSNYEVLIVGGGPVGMGLAIELGLRGISVGLVERRTEAHRIPKGQNLMQRTVDHFVVSRYSSPDRNRKFNTLCHCQCYFKSHFYH